MNRQSIPGGVASQSNPHVFSARRAKFALHPHPRAFGIHAHLQIDLIADRREPRVKNVKLVLVQYESTHAHPARTCHGFKLEPRDRCVFSNVPQNALEIPRLDRPDLFRLRL